MEIILPEFGAYFRDNDGRMRVAQSLYIKDGEREIIAFVIPPDDVSAAAKMDITRLNTPIEWGYRQALYKRAEEPNCEGIARYDLKSVER